MYSHVISLYEPIDASEQTPVYCFQMPDSPTPLMVLHSKDVENPLNPERITFHMDDVQVLLEDPSIDISFGLGVIFALYYVYGIEYGKGIHKTMLFLERFIFKLKAGSSLPVTVARV